jgi:hypothetical protein
MTYGEILERKSMITMTMIQDAESRAKGVTRAEMNSAELETTLFEYKRCVMDHDLEDENGRKLNLGNGTDVQRLDPKVGQEISDLIDKLNGLSASEDEQGNSPAESATQSSAAE